MPQSEAESGSAFIISQKGANSSRRPLEVHHLSHDLRGPLNSVLGFAELLLEGVEGPLNEHQEADITAIYHSAKNLLRLINTLVDLSKLEADRLKFEFGAVDLNQVIQNILNFDFGSNKPGQVKLVANLPEEGLLLRGDRDRVEQMIMSFVLFGFKRQRTGQTRLETAHSKQEGVVKVHLNSLTLSQEQLDELFELVVHVDPAGRSELGVGGLELPLTRALAQKHHGRVWVESNQDSGTTFCLSLPVYDQVNSAQEK
jgi:signal transduction histidine kinase